METHVSSGQGHRPHFNLLLTTEECLRDDKMQDIFLEPQINPHFISLLTTQECPGLKPPETDLCVERHSCSGGEHVLADQVAGMLAMMVTTILTILRILTIVRSMMLTTTLMAQVNIVGETLQGLNGPEMLPLLAEQSEKEVTVFITNINIFTLTTTIIT